MFRSGLNFLGLTYLWSFPYKNVLQASRPNLLK